MNKSSIAAMLLTTPNLTISGAIALQKEDNNKYFAEMVELPEKLKEGAVINEFRCLQNKQEGE